MSATDSLGQDGAAVFVGRDVEVRLVLSCAADASEGRATTLWLEGPAGSGKTALVREVLRNLPPGYQVLRAESDEMAREAELALIGQLGVSAAPNAFAAGMALVELLSAMEDRGPVALVVEDLHWADGSSRQALLTAARRLRHDRVLIIITSRPEEPDDGWLRFRADPDRCQVLAVGALSREEIVALAARLGVTMSGADAERLYRHTQGLPLYVGTLLRELTPEQLTGGGDMPAPRSLASATVARLSGLPPATRALAAALAVINQRVPLALAGRVAGIEHPTVALEGLLPTGFVTWSPGDPQTPIEFAHPLYRVAVYEDLTPSRRQQLHLAAAAHLDEVTALTHRVAAADDTDDELAEDLSWAARREIVEGSRTTAARYLLSASWLTSDREHKEWLLLEAARLLLADGHPQQAAELRARAEACSPSALRNLVLGLLAWEDGDAALAERTLLEVPLLASDEEDDGPTVAAALAELGRIYVTQIRPREALDVATRCLSLSPPDPEVERTAWIVLAYGQAMVHGSDAGLECLKGRLPETPDTAAPAEVELLSTRAAIGFYGGSTLAPIADLRAVVSLARRGATFAQLPRAHLYLAQLLRRAGQWDEALVQARVTLSLVSDERRLWIESQVHGELARILACRGEWDAAAAHVDAAKRTARSSQMFEAVFVAGIGEAMLARAKGDSRGVVDALTPLADHTQFPSNRLISLGWWTWLIEAMLDLGEADAAQETMRRLEEAAADRNLDMHAELLRLKGLLSASRHDPDGAASSFEQALIAFGPDDSVFERALTHRDFGRLLHTEGRRKEAVAQFAAARELLARMGAAPFLTAVEAELEACGLPSRQSPIASPFELTEREQDVVALVRKGMTNREIAAELYVSTKAVEYHLRNVFAKLGISSRRELRALSHTG